MKKIMGGMIIGLLSFGLLVGCSNTNDQSIDDSKKQSSVKNTEEKEVTLSLSNGTFKVGKDLEAGQYILVKQDNEYMGSFDITTDTTGDIESIVNSNAFENFEYIEVLDGQYLQLEKCTLYKIDEVPINLSNMSELTNGMFIVGKDIEAGEYKLEAIDGKQGWYSLYNSLAGGYKNAPDLQSSDFFTGSKLITLKEGQYLKLDSNTKIDK